MSRTFREVKRTMLPEPIPRADLERQLAEAREWADAQGYDVDWPALAAILGEKGA